ncbi:MAG: hypothetical protein KF900_03325 [Bacteroidetes bacterium]|nr:hypothetical protein [Bacteroidota bacterium]
MKNAVILIILIALVTCCTTKKEKLDLEEICKGIDNSHNCFIAIEKYQLPLNSENVRREKDTLFLKLNNGKTKKIIDKTEETNGDGCVYYNYREYDEDLNSYILNVQYYEGGDYLLINKAKGDTALIFEVPVLSPDRKRFLICNFDISGYTTNGIAIYRIENDKIIKEYYADENWGISEAEWINNDEISMEKIEYSEKSGDFVKTGNVKLKYDKNWHY